MPYGLLEKNGLTSALPEETIYLKEWDRFHASYARIQYYSSMKTYQNESVSWQTQYTTSDMQLEQTFNNLAKKWKRDTIHFSLVQQMVLHPAYQEIIGLGPEVIPLILHELEKEPNFWFWALRSLTGEDPVTEDMRGDVMAMREAWLDWGRRSLYL